MHSPFATALEELLTVVAQKAANEAIVQYQHYEQNRRAVPPEKQLLQKSEAAEFLGISISTVERWTRLGSLPVVRMGGLVRYSPDSLREWIKQKELEGSKKRSSKVATRTSTRKE